MSRNIEINDYACGKLQYTYLEDILYYLRGENEKS